MPIYTYSCPKCGLVWEALQRADISDPANQNLYNPSFLASYCKYCGERGTQIPSVPAPAIWATKRGTD